MKLHHLVLAVVTGALLVPNAALGEDAQIAKELSTQLRQAQAAGQLEQFRLGVKVEDGTVWLKGAVADEAQRDLALDRARRIPGVRLVINDISVGQSDAPGGPVPAESVPQAAAVVSHQSDAHLLPTPASGGPALAAPRPAMAPSMPTPAAPMPRPVSAARPVNFAQPAGGYAAAAGPAVNMLPVGYGGGGGYYEGAMVGDSSYSIDPGYGGGMGQPVPVQGYGYETQGGVQYEQPQMPGYAWPSYAAHPNYAAVTYPKQYSPMAWPYIGPFYPYPQVPLGWRKVTLEWDDGWWMLDFKSK